MKLYTRTKTACGLILLALSVLTISTNAHAGKADPKAAMLPEGLAQSYFNQPSVSVDARLTKALRGGTAARTATRGGDPLLCGNGAPDLGETCDDGVDMGTGMPVGGDGCSATCQIEDGAVCTAAATGIDIATNGSFADGESGWATGVRPIICGPFCTDFFETDLSSDGDEGFALFGSVGATAQPDSFLEQVIADPAGATTLTFDWFGASTAAPACDDDLGDRFVLSLTFDGGATTVFETNPDLDCSGSDYVTETIDLTTACGGASCLDGGPLTVRFNAPYPGVPSGNTNLFVDNITVNVPVDPAIPSECVVRICGDGILSPGELCDDGNLDIGDGCDASCNVEDDNWVCVNDFAEKPIDVLNGSLAFDEDLADGSLETGAPNDFWTEDGTVFAPICSTLFCGVANAQQGDFYAWFGGANTPNSQTLTQTDVDISPLATALTFQLDVTICDSDDDILSVNIDDQTVWARPCGDSTDPLNDGETNGYELQTVDLTGATNLTGIDYRGGTHTIQFAGVTLSSGENGNVDPDGNPRLFSNMYVDNISISYGVDPERDANPSDCFQLNELCGIGVVPSRGGAAPGFGIEQFNGGITDIMSTIELGSLSGPVNWTTTADEWTTVGDPSGCGSFGFDPNDDMAAVANWAGGNRTGGTGEAACIDSDGGSESLALPDAQTACIFDDETIIDPETNLDPRTDCQTKAYLCTPAIDTTNMTNPAVTATVNYQTATQDGDTDYGGTDPFDNDEVFEVIVGDVAPGVFSIPAYQSAGVILDHNTSDSFETTASTTIGVSLDAFRNPAVAEVPLNANELYVCFHYAGIFSWYAQVDNVGSRAGNCLVGDTDFDLVDDGIDNCTNVANNQVDSDGDGFGNRCDADFDNNCEVDFGDLQALATVFFQPAVDNPEFDIDGVGDAIDFTDLQLVAELIFLAPGPSPASPCVASAQ